MPEDRLDELLSVVSDLRVEKHHNPRLKFKKDQPKQMEFIGDTHIINIALCGNQWGKSFAMAYKIAALATGENPEAPHQPDPTRPLQILVVGPSWSKISETVQKDLTTLLRKDEWEIGVRKGSYIGKIVIHGPKKSRTEVLFMPSSTEKQEDSQEFEGSKFHYAFVDEGIKPDLFRKILVRLGSSDGRFYQAFTRLPDTLHLAHHLIDLEKGKGEFKYLIEKGWVNIVAASNIENKYLDKRQKEMLAAGAGTAQDMELYEKLIPIWTDPEKKEQKLELLEQMTENFKARIFGVVDRPTGAVFNFREEVQGKNYNMIGFDEMTAIWKTEEGRWDLDHDYGQGDPATWKLIWTSRKTGSSYFIDEVYRAGMSHQQSCEELYEMLHRWKCYNAVQLCFADKQIRDKGRKDKRTDPDITIEQQYKAKRMPNGDPCIPPHLQFICKQSDKNNFSHTLSMVQSLVEEENPLTPGLPYFRFTYLVENCVRELKTLRWNPRDPKSTNSRVEETLGDNHAIDPMRYFANNKINLAMWEERYKLKAEFNELAYEVGGSGNMVFNI
jgi:hypothetical protein